MSTSGSSTLSSHAGQGRHRKGQWSPLSGCSRSCPAGLTSPSPPGPAWSRWRLGQPDALLHVVGLGVAVGLLGEHALPAAGEQHRREEPLGVVVQSLLTAGVVDGGPAGHGPAVVELPVYGAHAHAPDAPEMLHAVANGLTLQQLRGVQGRLKLGWDRGTSAADRTR